MLLVYFLKHIAMFIISVSGSACFLYSIIIYFLIKFRHVIKLSVKQKFCILVSCIILSIIILNFFPKYGGYTINNKKVYELEFITNLVADLISDETEIIDIEISKIEVLPIEGKRYGNIFITRKDIKYRYVMIDNMYIVPISIYSVALISKSLYEYVDSKDNINQIIVYKNTKLIKEINGVNINSNAKELVKSQNKNKYKMRIDVNNGKITYETSDGTIDEYLRKKEANLCIYNNQRILMFNVSLHKDGDDFATNLPGGSYSVVVCDIYHKSLSNTIYYDVQNRKVSNIVVGND